MVLPDYDCFKDLHRHYTPSNHEPKARHLDPLQYNGHHSLHRNRLLLCHPLPMLADLLFLEHQPKGFLRQPRCHHRPHISIQRLQCHLGFHLRYPANLLGSQAQHGKEDEACYHPPSRHGLRVSNPSLSLCCTPAHIIQGQRSCRRSFRLHQRFQEPRLLV